MSNPTPPATDLQFMAGQAMELAGPVLQKLEAGELTAQAGAAQLVQTFGGFLDLAPDHVRALMVEFCAQLAVYGGASSLAERDKAELAQLRHILAELNSRESTEVRASPVPKYRPKPGEPGYDPSKDPHA